MRSNSFCSRTSNVQKKGFHTQNYVQDQIRLRKRTMCLASLSKSFIFNSFPASGDIDHLLITFAASLNPDQARRSVSRDLGPNCLQTTKVVTSKEKVKLWNLSDI